jgi:hypothetical protein
MFKKCLRKKIPSNFKFVHVFRNIPLVITLLISLVIGYNQNDSLFVRKGSLETDKKLGVFKVNFQTTGRATAASMRP